MTNNVELIQQLTNEVQTTTECILRATSDYINSCKRVDRDRVIKLKSRLDTLNNILKLIYKYTK